MFIQVIQGTVKDAELLRSQAEVWYRDLKPRAVGYLGSTGGSTPDGRSITLVRFESREAAVANGNDPEQTAWWEATAGALDDVVFHDCDLVDTLLGGGSDDAGFVQVIQGRARDQEELRTRAKEFEKALAERRPDILGMVVAWHGDGGFTQAVYFTSEAETRRRETATEADESRGQFMSMLEGTPTFFDLTTPELD